LIRGDLYRGFQRLANLWVRIKTALWWRWFFRRCGKNCRLRFQRLIHPECIELGDRVHIFDGARIEAVMEYRGHKYQPQIKIGSGVSIGQNFHCTCSNSIEIGEEVSITAGVTISDTTHSYEDIEVPIEHQPLRNAPVVIGPWTKIHNGAVILPGVHIGRHCMVGANSVVTHDVPDYSVAVGNPAKVVRQYIPGSGRWERVPVKKRLSGRVNSGKIEKERHG